MEQRNGVAVYTPAEVLETIIPGTGGRAVPNPKLYRVGTLPRLDEISIQAPWGKQNGGVNHMHVVCALEPVLDQLLNDLWREAYLRQGEIVASDNDPLAAVLFEVYGHGAKVFKILKTEHPEVVGITSVETDFLMATPETPEGKESTFPGGSVVMRDNKGRLYATSKEQFDLLYSDVIPEAEYDAITIQAANQASWNAVNEQYTK